MAQSTDSNSFEQKVLDRLDKLDGDIKDINDDIKDINTRFDAYLGDIKDINTRFDAYLKASEKIERMATTIIITAGTVTLLSPVLQALSPAIRAVLTGVTYGASAN